jgi:hypothetical protein
MEGKVWIFQISELISGYECIWPNMDLFEILKLVLGFWKILGGSGSLFECAFYSQLLFSLQHANYLLQEGSQSQV